MRDEATKHKEAISKEYQRRAEKARQIKEAKEKAAAEKAERKRLRNEARERARLAAYLERMNVLSLNA